MVELGCCYGRNIVGLRLYHHINRERSGRTKRIFNGDD